jgi:D-glutamate cyclase
MAHVIGEYIDRLCSVEMRPQGNLPRGVTHLLYDAARAAQGDRPLTLLAASALLERVRKGDHVLILTGTGAPPGLPKGETDGPLGAAALARTLDLGIGAKPVIVTEERLAEPIKAAVEAAGVSLLDREAVRRRSHAGVLEVFPVGIDEGKNAATRLLDTYRPSAVIFVEKAGPNQHGIFHSILGYARGPDIMGSAYWLADVARSRSILTVGVGDGGNEIGFGKIRDAVREIQPFGRVCRCPCKGGVATVTDCDILVACAVSNWGAYGISACLAFLLKNVELIQDEETERRMLESCVNAGCTDSVVGAQVPAVDGVPLGVQLALVRMLGAIVSTGHRVIEREF